ncbi:MAG: hypothetical protein AAGJ37_00490 [Pseudomonadota bacterium]
MKIKRPLKGWRAPDIVMSILLLLAAIAMMMAAGLNMYSILLGSGNIVYHENKGIAIAVSALSACAGLVFKALPMTFRSAVIRQHYYTAFFSMTAITVIVWLYFLATTAGSISIDDVLGGDNQDAIYTYLQLLVEVFLSSCLFIGWQLLFDSYQPMQQTLNPKRKLLDDEIDSLTSELKPINERIEATIHAIALYESQRGAFVQQQLDRLMLLKARHSTINQFLGEDQ